MTSCPRCGVIVPNDTNFCGNCGAPSTPQQYAYAAPPAPYSLSPAPYSLSPQRRTNVWVIVGLVAAVVVVAAIVGIVLHATLKNRHHPTLTPTESGYLTSDVRGVAAAEERYVRALGTYTSDRFSLGRAGFTTYPGNPEYDELTVGYNGARGYCIVGAVNDEAPWVLYDSQNGLMRPLAFSTAQEAESYCSDKSITNFVTVN